MSSRRRAVCVLVAVLAVLSATVSAAAPVAAVSSSTTVTGVPSAGSAAMPGGQTSDTTLPAGMTASYTVAALRSTQESPESAPATATVPAWDGPYSPARRSLTMVWDEAEGGPSTGRQTTQATADSPVPLTQDWANGLMGFAAGPGSVFALALDTPDGEYSLGRGDGQLAVSAQSGARCTGPGGPGGDVPSGTATVRRTAPSLFGYAAISVDADLVCADGHHLRVELRWNTPDDVHRLDTAPMTVLETEPGQVSTREVPVTNAGSVPATLGAARLVAADMSTAAPLTVSGSTCEGRTLASGESCAVTITHTAGAADSTEGNGFLVLAGNLGDVELGRVVGQQPAARSGPQNVAVTGAPGRVGFTWTRPLTLDSRLIDSWRVEEDTETGPKVLFRAASYAASARATGLAVGPHRLRVVLRTIDGREVSTAPIAVTVPERWLLVATRDGVSALDPQGKATDRGLFGAAIPALGVSTSPSRDKVVAAYDFVPHRDALVHVLTQTGDGVRILTRQLLNGDRAPAVSPDGERVVVQRFSDTGSQYLESSLVLVPTTGGTETVIPASAGLGAPSWTPDGTAVVADQISGAGLVKVDVASGARTPLPGTTNGYAPSVSRTGRLAYVASAADGHELRVTSLTGGPTTRLAIDYGSWDLEWDPTGRWLAVTGGAYQEPQHTYVYDMSATPRRVATLPGGSAVTWLDTASAAPRATLTAPAWSRTSASLSVGGSDPDDPVGGLRRECRLDAATTWTTCGSTWSLTGLAPGRHTGYARVTDPSGHASPVATRSWTVDGTAPTATLGPVPAALTAATTTLSWTAADSGSGPASYDLRQRYASISGRLGGYVYPPTWRGLRPRSLGFRLTPGSQYCWSVRAHDVAGNIGAWSNERCTSVALDDRALTSSTGWARGTSTSHAYGTWSRARRSAATLKRGSVQARRIAVVADTCPTCGAVEVFHAGRKLGRIGLYSARTAHRQIRWLPLQPVTRTGALVIRTTSSKAVYVDGVIVAH